MLAQFLHRERSAPGLRGHIAEQFRLCQFLSGSAPGLGALEGPNRVDQYVALRSQILELNSVSVKQLLLSPPCLPS
jgi:hypothetical protein